MKNKKLIIIIYLLGLILGGCNSAYHFQVIDVSSIWKTDTCGLNGERAKLTPFIVNRPNPLIGMSTKKIIDFFGEPDFIYEMKSFGEVIVYSYSTSSLEILEKDKCSEPVISNFAVLFDKSSMKVKNVKEFVH